MPFPQQANLQYAEIIKKSLPSKCLSSRIIGPFGENKSSKIRFSSLATFLVTLIKCLKIKLKIICVTKSFHILI